MSIDAGLYDGLALTPKTVVVAIDAPDVVDRFSTALRRAGHRVIGAGHAQALFRAVESPAASIDLIVLDVGLEGLEAGSPRIVERLRQTAPRIPIAAFSRSIRSARDVRTLAGLGVERYVDEHVTAGRILPALAPLLSPNSFDRRTSPRRTLGIPAALRCGETIVPVFTLNIGSGGLAVRAMTALTAGARVTVRFRLPRPQREIEVAARVVWSDRQSALGLQFEDVDTADQAAIDEFVDAPDGTAAARSG